MSQTMDIANAARSIPAIFAFLLGIVGTLAPCQLTGNISAITLYSNSSLQKGVNWKNIISFTIGKVLAFMLLGGLVWIAGRELQDELPTYFPWIRKTIGPLLILTGLVLLGIWKPKFILFSGSNSTKASGIWGSFSMGFLFSLAFCPTMFFLFFGSLIPYSLSISYGYILPSLFALGTAVPVFVLIGIISYLGFSGSLMKKSRKIGKYFQIAAGTILLLIGIYDSILYWF
jgi:cytochrome c biogenesis protein CcdA